VAWVVKGWEELKNPEKGGTRGLGGKTVPRGSGHRAAPGGLNSLFFKPPRNLATGDTTQKGVPGPTEEAENQRQPECKRTDNRPRRTRATPPTVKIITPHFIKMEKSLTISRTFKEPCQAQGARLKNSREVLSPVWHLGGEPRTAKGGLS